MKLIETQREVHYECELGHVLARTFNPSPRYGGWPGTPVVIREWQLCPTGCGTYRKCNQDEILKFERMLGEWNFPIVINHPTFGLVATLKK